MVVEVGVWKGGSVVFMAKCLRDLGIDGVIIAVDTWLGSSEHWLRPEWRADLKLHDGYPTLYRTFERNIVLSGVQDLVIPLPLDSINAAALLRRHGISPDVVHLDAGHEHPGVLAALETWWELLRPGGLLVADDYDPTGESWPRARDAIDTFVATTSPATFRAAQLKATMTKPSGSTPPYWRAVSSPDELEARLNEETLLWRELNARLRYFVKQPSLRFTVTQWPETLPPIPDASVLRIDWSGENYELFLDPLYFRENDHPFVFVLQRALVTASLFPFITRIAGRTEGFAVVCLSDFGHPNTLSFSARDDQVWLIPDAQFLWSFA